MKEAQQQRSNIAAPGPQINAAPAAPPAVPSQLKVINNNI